MENKEIQNEVQEEKKSMSTWESVMLGGIPGIVLGAAGAIVTQGFVNGPGPGPGPNNEIPVAHTPNDSMSFREAFEAARAEVGPGGAFVWHGNVYSTYRSDDPEWIAMGPEGQAEHCHDIMMQVHPEPYTSQAGNSHPNHDNHDTDHPAGTTHDNEQGDNDNHPVNDPPQIESDVHIVDIDTDPETGETAAIGEVDGVLTVFVDQNGDGVVDTIYHDDNGDGHVTSDEQHSPESSGITISELADEMDRGEDVELYDNQPDYSQEETSPDYENQANVDGF